MAAPTTPVDLSRSFWLGKGTNRFALARDGLAHRGNRHARVHPYRFYQPDFAHKWPTHDVTPNAPMSTGIPSDVPPVRPAFLSGELASNV